MSKNSFHASSFLTHLSASAWDEARNLLYIYNKYNVYIGMFVCFSKKKHEK